MDQQASIILMENLVFKYEEISQILILNCFLDNLKMNKRVEDQLVQIVSILQSEGESCELCAVLEGMLDQSLPKELCNAVFFSEQLNQIKQIDGVSFFWGLDFISGCDLVSQYKDKRKPDTFFSCWGVDEKFNIKESLGCSDGFSLEYGFDGELEDAVLVKNVTSLIPLLCFEDHYILYSLGDACVPKGLLYISNEGFGSMVAPTILEHLEDLLKGVQSGLYFVGSDGLVFPHNWFNRIKLRNGEVTMDEYGQIVEDATGADDDYHKGAELPWFVKLWLKFWKK